MLPGFGLVGYFLDVARALGPHTPRQPYCVVVSVTVTLALRVGLPQFVEDEFAAFLECGILAHSFLRLRRADCGHNKPVTFSCERCGFCHPGSNIPRR